METLEFAKSQPSALNGAGRDRERERREDLDIFRIFLGGLELAQSENETLRSEGTRKAREAFTKIYLRYRERVYAYSLRVLANSEDAEDIFQEVFFRV